MLKTLWAVIKKISCKHPLATKVMSQDFPDKYQDADFVYSVNVHRCNLCGSFFMDNGLRCKGGVKHFLNWKCN